MKFALQTVQKFSARWEAAERENLKADIDRKVGLIETEKAYKENLQSQDVAHLEVVEEDACKAPEGQDPLDDDKKEIAKRHARFAALTKCFHDPEGSVSHQQLLEREKLTAEEAAKAAAEEAGETGEQKPVEEFKHKYYPCYPEQWKQAFSDLRHLHVMKHPRVLQTLFYMLGFTREQICHRDTNALDFRKAKELINEELFAKMGNYKPTGQRDRDFKEYQKISFLRTNNNALDEEKVEDYSLVLRKVLDWIRLALEIRIDDVKQRRDQVEYIKFDREAAIKQETERKSRYNEDLKEAKAAFEEKAAEEAEKEKEDEGEEPEAPKQFDEEEFKKNFDEQNPEVPQIDAPAEEIDRDYDLPYKPPAMDQD
jgi:hypothetical protein